MKPENQPHESILSALKTRILVADGAMGTQLHQKGIPPSSCFEFFNIGAPELVKEVHNAYLQAGANIIETNTFGANRQKLKKYNLSDKVELINRQGVAIARECAGANTWVAGSMGPLGRDETGELTDEKRTELYQEQASALQAVDLVILETFSSLQELVLALKAVKAAAEVPVCCQLVLNERGKTIAGDDALYSLLTLDAQGADIVGANCGVGPHGLVGVMKKAAAKVGALVSVFPNAGYPEQREDRTFYVSSPEYFADAGRMLAGQGVNLIGGCCGTTPLDIAALAKAVSGLKPVMHTPVTLGEASRQAEARASAQTQIAPGTFLDKLKAQKVISVELDPPKGLAYEKVIEGARELKAAGADVISIAENPLAVSRMSNTTLANLIQDATGMETIVHLCGRDHNLIGMQSRLMGLAVEGVKNILAITGDPPSRGREEKVTGVFDLRSYELISLLKKLNSGTNYYGEDIRKKTAFAIGAAFNPNTANMATQIKRMEKKIELGAQFFQTQPIYSREKMEEILERTASVKVPILLGILPLVSSRNAEFLNSEFPGISIPADVRERMKAAGEKGEAEGVEIAWELIQAAWPHFGGIYIMPPFNRYRVAVALIERIKSLS